MKTHLFILVSVLLIGYPILTKAQETNGGDSLVQSNVKKIDSQKGKFNVAIQSFAFTESSQSFSTRVGYLISNHDMVFLDGQFSWNPRDQVDRTIETSLNYRRYMGNRAFQPFVQTGIGLGHISYSNNYYTGDYQKNYGVFEIGAGVSFRYKRWGFEVGVQAEYNHNYTGRTYLVPLWGISFSF